MYYNNNKKVPSKTISRVMSLDNHLSRHGVAAVLKRRRAQATNLKRDGPPHCFYPVLLRMGFTCALAVTREAVVSYTAFPPLPGHMYAELCL